MSTGRAVPLTFIDLFCGCGGFSLGLQRAGLRCLAAVDFNDQAVDVFRVNFPDVSHILKFWRDKIAGNQVRDRLVTRTLRARGGRVLRIWEHELKRKNECRLIARLNRALAT